MKKKWVIVGIVILSLLLVAVVIHTVAVIRSGAGLDAELAALEEAGMPLTIADIEPPPLAEEENAAVDLEQATAILVDTDSANNDLRPEWDQISELVWSNENETLTAEEQQTAADLLARDLVTQVMDRIEAALGKSGYRPDLDYSLGPMLQLPNLRGLRTLARLLALQARMAAHRGAAAEAVGYLTQGLELAELLADQPLLITQLLRLAMRAEMFNSLARVVEVVRLTDGQWQQILAEMNKVDNVRSLSKGLDGERILFGDWIFQTLAADSDAANKRLQESGHLPPPYGSYLFKPARNADRAVILQFYRLARESIQDGAPAQVDGDALLQDAPAYCLLAKVNIPVINPRNWSAFNGSPELRRAAIALFRHELAHGSFPESLDALGDVPQDPVAAKPFHYEKTESGFVIYGVGSDGKDDGGDADTDIVWRYEPVHAE